MCDAPTLNLHTQRSPAIVANLQHADGRAHKCCFTYQTPTLSLELKHDQCATAAATKLAPREQHDRLR